MFSRTYSLRINECIISSPAMHEGYSNVLTFDSSAVTVGSPALHLMGSFPQAIKQSISSTSLLSILFVYAYIHYWGFDLFLDFLVMCWGLCIILLGLLFRLIIQYLVNFVAPKYFSPDWLLVILLLCWCILHNFGLFIFST